MIRFLIYALGFYLLFRLIFNFIIPLFITTRQVRQQFNDIKNRARDQVNDPYAPQARENPRPEKVRKEDYLDFEEVKEKKD
jgi:hypothetical protein